MSENRVTLFHIRKFDAKTKALTSMWDNPHGSDSAKILLEAKKSIQKAQKLLRKLVKEIEKIKGWRDRIVVVKPYDMLL